MTKCKSGTTVPHVASPTPTHQLADLLLGDAGPLERFVRERRAAGVAWRVVARELYEATDQRVDVTFETLRTWFPEASGQVAS